MSRLAVCGIPSRRSAVGTSRGGPLPSEVRYADGHRPVGAELQACDLDAGAAGCRESAIRSSGVVLWSRNCVALCGRFDWVGRAVYLYSDHADEPAAPRERPRPGLGTNSSVARSVGDLALSAHMVELGGVCG